MAAPSSILLSYLPSELLDKIVQRTPASDRLSLCRTSKLFNVVCTRWIYRNVSLHSPRDIVNYCQTLTTHHSVALFVKRLVMECNSNQSSQPRLQCYYALISKMLGSITQSFAFKLVTNDLDFLKVIDQCTLSHLERFECFVPNPNVLPAFLARHPTVQALTIALGTTPINRDDFPQTHLPYLRHFTGPSTLVTFFIPPSQIGAVEISRDTLDENYEIEFMLTSIAQCSDPSPFIKKKWLTWDPSLILEGHTDLDYPQLAEWVAIYIPPKTESDVRPDMLF